MRLVVAIIMSASQLSLTAPARAQSFPNRAIRLVIALPPGSAADVVARLFAPHMAERITQNLVIDNRPGASGIIATEIVKNARADGYTLLVTSSSFAISATLHSKLPYDPVKDFTFIGKAGSTPSLLVVNPQLPAHSVREFIALAKAKPGELRFGSSGSGTSVHLTAELFNSLAGIKATHVPYKGAALTLNDLVAGQIQFAFSSIAASNALVRGGRLRVLGVTALNRHKELPDVPAVAETLPGYEAIVWIGVFGPAAMPSPIVDTLNQALNDSLRAPEVSARLAAAGVTVATSTPDEFGAYVRAEIGKWGQIAKTAGARAEQ
jgi:tripartite-type tricarboxylate transporter receptor subunit TctC